DKIWSNPSYLGKKDYNRNDIALLRLSNSVQFSSKLSPICLPNANQSNFHNLFYLGWGKVGVGKDASNDLLYVDTKPSDDCYRVFYPAFVKEKQFCTQAKGKGICDGDSGGPLSSKINGHVTQVGINSYVALGTCGEKPEVTTRVSAFLKDIYSVTDGSNWCRNPNKN
ncbi:Polyserase-2-like protein, partial [Leptotrombidium deliense]